MCGIAGIVRPDHKAVRPVDLLRMSRALGHRGPDDEGFVLVDRKTGDHRAFAGRDTCREKQHALPRLEPISAPGPASLGLLHRRFSIIDPSAAGHQPFFAADGSACVVFNGELYNYVELREELARDGVAFRTHSDTEVLIEAWRRWGEACFERFNGFWALAIYDFTSRRVLLSRDRFGKKPLFCTRFGDSLAFASEIKALLRIPEVDDAKAVNERAVAHWLSSGRKNLSNESFFEGITMLPAGTFAWVEPDTPIEPTRYWTLPRERLDECDVSVDEAAESIRSKLEDAVRIRLRADVPISVELSGGMDSSSLAALASGLRSEPLRAYTVRFSEKAWNEEPFARLVADRFDLDYRVLENPSGGFWHDLLAFTYLEEEPYHAPNLQTNQVVWQQMRQAGTRVSLNGAAGDEVFAGYAGYFHAALLENLRRGELSGFARNLVGHTESSSPLRSGARFARHLAASVGGALRTPKHAVPFSSRLARQTPLPNVGHLLSSQLRADMTDRLIPYWLCSGDRGTMGVPLEIRAPFLDHRVVEYAFRLPVSYLIRDGWHKWILRKAMDPVLPPEVNWRRTKLGFPFPMERFLDDNAEIIRTVLASSTNPYLALDGDPDSPRSRAIGRDWRAISFLLWFELFFNENVALFDRIESLARARTQRTPQGVRPRFHDTAEEIFAGTRAGA